MPRSIPRTGVLLVALLLGACATFQQYAALRQVAFGLAGVQDGRLAGVPLDRIRNSGDLSALELGRLGLALARNDVPLEFRVNVRAENPADNPTSATMVKLAWTLLLDDKETIHGDWTRPTPCPRADRSSFRS